MNNEEAKIAHSESVERWLMFGGKYLELVVEAIEKQVAKKPIIKVNDYGDNSCYCSSCTTQFLGNISSDNIPYSIINFCPKCGQKIDWSDEYDK